MNLDLVRQLGPPSNWLAVVATTRPDGSVHASLVNAGLVDGDLIGFVARGDARKLALIRQSGRASLTWRDGWMWVTVEGPVARIDSDAALMRDVFRGAGGTHDDWDEYDRVMREEHRTAVLITPERVLKN